MRPNSDRSLDEKGQNPAELFELAKRLLADTYLAVDLVQPGTALSLARGGGDENMWRTDRDAGEALFASKSAQRVGGPLGFFIRAYSRRAERQTIIGLRETGKRVTANRKAMKREWGLAGREWLDYESDPSLWPEGRHPIDIHLDLRDNPGVFLTPYQLTASGWTLIVYAVGKVLGDRDGHALSQDFMRMIIAHGTGREIDGVTPEMAVKGIEGDFYERAMKGSSYWHGVSDNPEHDCPKKLLKGPDEHLAITILGAYLRMGVLGVRSLDGKAHRRWEEFFDGIHYGVPEELLGNAWTMTKKEVDDLHMNIEDGKLPSYGDKVPLWHYFPGGVPVIFAGIVTRLLEMAIERFTLLDTVTNDSLGIVGGENVSVNREDFTPVGVMTALRARLGMLQDSRFGHIYSARLPAQID